ncbi:unnamed protein product [Peronospora farinosa]|uniref:Peptidase S1 domain-containing protein n=1 Tax=Peronospora farinosa TaxID=134698 RepID=A0AAV0SS93_9STRA|nr:unnamed protein product [Peronospora farinosa]
MKFAAGFRAGVLTSVLIATLTKGYTFIETTDSSTDSAAKEERIGLKINKEARIFGGSEADAARFPFIVSLRKDTASSNTYCGGTLIASQYVVTAGHCVMTDGTTMYASIGSAFGSGSSDGQQIQVIKGYRHPLYNTSAHRYDIGVLKLERGVPTKTIELCAADGTDNEVGQIATVGGWGLTENGSQSLLLKKVDVRIISNVECNKQYSNRITKDMLCAGGGNGKDSCSGDSGGPLIANNVLVGIVSWGGRCGLTAGVYTRVSYVQDYINDILSGGNGSTFASSSVDQRSASINRTNTGTTSKAFASKTLVKAAVTTAPALIAATTDVPTGKIESSLDIKKQEGSVHHDELRLNRCA